MPQIVAILANHSVSLAQTKSGLGGAGRKTEDGKEEKQLKKQIAFHVNALMLNNNFLRNISGLYSVLDQYVLHDIHRI